MSNIHALRGRLGGLTTAARHDSHETTKAARQAFHDRFIDQARAEATAKGECITEVEAVKRGEALRTLHYARMSYARWGNHTKEAPSP